MPTWIRKQTRPQLQHQRASRPVVVVACQSDASSLTMSKSATKYQARERRIVLRVSSSPESEASPTDPETTAPNSKMPNATAAASSPAIADRRLSGSETATGLTAERSPAQPEPNLTSGTFQNAAD